MRHNTLTSRPIAMSGFATFILMVSVFGLVMHAIASNTQSNEDVELTLLDDTYVASGSPEAVFGRYNNLWFGFSPAGNVRSLVSVFKFDTSELPLTGQLDGAELQFYVFSLRGLANSTTLTVKRIADSSAWSESSLTWNSYQALTFGPEHQITVLLTSGLNRLDVTPLLQEAMALSEQTISIAIEYTPSDVQSEAIAALRSKEYDQEELRPVLKVTYVLPPPTPSPTPSATPGTKYVSLQNYPTSEIIPDSVLTYTILVSNGPYTLSNIVVTNTAPGPLVILPGTIDNGSMGWQHQIAGQEITWTLNQLNPNALAQLRYQAAHPTPTPSATPTTLAITKSGPQYVAPGELITYTLHVDNQTPYTLTDVTITDTLPTALTIVDPGGALTTALPAQLVWQETAPLTSGAMLTWTFSGRADVVVTEVVNADYRVHATITHSETQEAISAPGVLPVTTVVTTTPPAMLAPVIINAGACVHWSYTVPGEPFQTGVHCSGPTFNPLRAQWLPFVSR